ncbi:hypothetical protein AGMMS49531_10130 [Endomicrobiia bacterium]|nr:hypothetical protein AGMMS49531_10130 [Endomicrobiia bacterium]
MVVGAAAGADCWCWLIGAAAGADDVDADDDVDDGTVEEIDKLDDGDVSDDVIFTVPAPVPDDSDSVSFCCGSSGVASGFSGGGVSVGGFTFCRSSFSLIFSGVAVLLFTRNAFFLSQELKTKKTSKISEIDNLIFLCLPLDIYLFLCLSPDIDI